MMRRNSKFFKWGVTAFVVLVAAVLFWLIFSNLKGVYELILEFLSIISALLYGCVFAYLMNPILEFAEKIYGRILKNWKCKDSTKHSVIRTAGVATTVLIFLGTVYAFFALIIPSIAGSISELIRPEKLQEYYDTVKNWVHDVFADSAVEKWVDSNFSEVLSIASGFLQNLNIFDILLGAASSVYTVFEVAFNMVIGVIAGVYILVYKQDLCSQAKKLTIALCREEKANRVFEIARRTNHIFSGFVIGKLIDAAFVGIVTYIALLIMDMPFAPLIATIVGVTNIIPFFGPFIGGVPSALLLLIDNPINAVYFGIFLLILQMIDGNIIENRILGEKLGISDFWVLVTILVAGGIFGFVGMLLGVPIFAVIYTVVSDAVNKRLRKKNLPTDTDLYGTLRSVADLPTPPPVTETVKNTLSYDRNRVEEDDCGGDD